MSHSPTLDEACALLALNAPPAFRLATETLFRIVQNVVSAPDEEKFRTIRRQSNAFSQQLANAKGAVRFLKACGFVAEGEGDGAAFVLPADTSTELLVRAKAALKALVKQHAAEVEEARRLENEHAAGKLSELKAVSKLKTAERDAAEAGERQRLREGLKADREEWVRQRDPNNIK